MGYGVPYCGTAPVPGELAGRFNTDAMLIAMLLLLMLAHVRALRGDVQRVPLALAGWAAAAAAFVSPLCALSVALFSARVAQHMILILIAAPLLALAMPPRWEKPAHLWPATLAFLIALWFWHMPAPYTATFRSTPLYWTMHMTLFGSAIWLWSALLAHPPKRAASALAAGTMTSMQMGLLGAVLTFSSHALFVPHYFTTIAWGFTPLGDQQLGGALMWVPGCLLFLTTSLRSASLLWRAMEPARIL
jgi:putative membrane protein